MDEETRVFVAAELTKINFLLENLFAVVLHNAGATPDDIPALSAELERQAELPGTTYNAPANDTEESDAVQELVRSRIVKFFDGVEKRLRSAEQ